LRHLLDFKKIGDDLRLITVEFLWQEATGGGRIVANRRSYSV